MPSTLHRLHTVLLLLPGLLRTEKPGRPSVAPQMQRAVGSHGGAGRTAAAYLRRGARIIMGGRPCWWEAAAALCVITYFRTAPAKRCASRAPAESPACTAASALYPMARVETIRRI